MVHRPVELFLARLEKLKKSPGGWIAACPAHEDRSPSLSITETHEGHVLLMCFAGCTAFEICAALGLREADLFDRDDCSQTHLPRIPRLDREEISLQVWFAAVFVADLRAGHPVRDADAVTYAKCIASLIKCLPLLLSARADHLASQVATVLLQYLDEKKARSRGL